MSLVLETHQQNVANAVHQYHAEISEIEVHLRLRAMANDVSDRDLALLRRLKNEKIEILYRYENLREAFRALIGQHSVAANDTAIADGADETNSTSLRV